MPSWIETRFEGWPADGTAIGRDRITRARVHLKLARSVDGSRAIDREVAVASAVHHPALGTLLDHGWIGGVRAAAFEWIDASPLSIAASERAAIDVLRALLALHASGFVHGDLKPEHVLVGARATRLIDLGLAVRIGEAPAGGTTDYLAPEYRSGALASVAGDLFAFGRTFAPFASEGSTLAALALRACDPEPSGRPASAEAALVALGARPRARDRLARMHRMGDALVDRVGASDVRHVRVLAPAGSGGTSFAHALARSGAVVALPEHAGIALALARESSDPIRIVVDGAYVPDETDPPCIVVGEVDAPDFTIEPLDAPSTERLARERHASISTDDCLRLTSACEGRAGRIVRVLDRMEGVAVLSLADALRIGRVAVGSNDVVAEAASALADGAARVATMLLIERWPDLEARGDHAARLLLADALAASGELARAADLFAAIEPLPDAALLSYARTLERLGRLDVLASLRDPEVGATRADLGAMKAAALFTRGHLAEARALAEASLAIDGASATARTRLLCIASDATLRSGDGQSALALAERALVLATSLDAPAPLAQSHARVAGAHAMAGRWVEARRGYVAALEAAERANDRSALSPYLMNLAAAEHALFEVDLAISHYERAVALARELGRAPSEAAALTNLGTLLELVGADAEAAPLLERAESLASERGAVIAVAQARMFRAEVERSRGVREQALDLATRARQGFVEAGAERQALECGLLLAELAADRGEAAFAQRFVEMELSRAKDAGLGARVALLAARVRDPAGAARILESALADAERSGEREWMLRITIALAEAHTRLATGAAPAFEARARELRGSLALHVPPGLRERFIARHRLPEPEAPRKRFDPAARAIASLLRRTLRATDETLVLEAAVDEAIALTQAERAFLLARRPGRPVVSVARNLDRETIKNSRFRFSRSVAERVLSTGEPLVTASASDDPELASARSILDLGVRSILCVPIRGRGNEVLHALYLDHRFERARFSEADLEIVEALADVIGLCLENARLHGAAEARERELVLGQESLRADAEAKAIEVERLSRTLEAREPENGGGIVGRSRSLRAAIDLTRRVAPSAISVLIEGESGTGKELFARLLHRESPRSKQPMLAVNCGALPEALLESELFGHVRGAFTGALRDHPGLFRAADGGTLFLDEIGEMPASMQARLLRVLADGEVRPVGATRGMKVDVRVVAATNRDLSAEVKRGGFREDLFFRIAGVRITLPALRDRREDLPLLVAAILGQLGETRPLAPDAMRALVLHALPGNVRELEQALRRASIVADGETLRAADLGLEGNTRGPRSREPTRAEIEAALNENRGNRSHAAATLGLHRTTVHRLMSKHGIESETRRGRPRLR